MQLSLLSRSSRFIPFVHLSWFSACWPWWEWRPTWRLSAFHSGRGTLYRRDFSLWCALVFVFWKQRSQVIISNKRVRNRKGQWEGLKGGKDWKGLEVKREKKSEREREMEGGGGGAAHRRAATSIIQPTMHTYLLPCLWRWQVVSYHTTTPALSSWSRPRKFLQYLLVREAFATGKFALFA